MKPSLRAKIQKYSDSIPLLAYRDFYTGVSKISFPVVDSSSKVETFQFYTTSFVGSISSPYFNTTFEEEKFEKTMCSKVQVIVPKSLSENEESQVQFIIKYDMEKTSHYENINVDIYNKEKVYRVALDNTKTKKYLSYATHDHNGFSIMYCRNMKNEYLSWTKKRNTGMNVAWYYFRLNEGRFHMILFLYLMD